MFVCVEDSSRRSALKNSSKKALQANLELYYRGVYDKQEDNKKKAASPVKSKSVAKIGGVRSRLAQCLEASPTKVVSYRAPVDRKVFIEEKVARDMGSLQHLQRTLYDDDVWLAKYESKELGLQDIVDAYKKLAPRAEGLFVVFCSSNLIASTSANPERMFSVCGNIENKRNKGTSSDLVNNSRAFCKNNQEYFPSTKRVVLYLNYSDGRGTEKTRSVRKYDAVRDIQMKEGWKKRLKRADMIDA